MSKKTTAMMMCFMFCSLFAFKAHSAVQYCTPTGVNVYSSRIHVKCANSINGIRYFAVSTKNSTQAERFLTITSAAFAAGRDVILRYNPLDTGGESFGCRSSNCRKATSVGLR